MSRVAVMLLFLLAGVASLVLGLKHEVARLEVEERAVRAAVAELEGEIRVLRARYAYLARPQRLAALAAELGMEPATAARMVALEDIGTRAELAWALRVVALPLPSGASVPVRARPVVPVSGEAGR